MSNEKKALSAKLRTADFGSAGSRRLLRGGEIPAVVYGKSEPMHVVVNAHEFMMKKSGFSESTLITLSVAGEKDHMVFVKSYQEDLLRGCVRHIDFFEVTAGHTVRTHVRIELEGNPVGCRQGGVLELQVPAGIKIHEDPEATIASVKFVKEEAPAETAADEAAPEAAAADTADAAK